MVAKHRDVSRRTSDVAGLPIPDDRCGLGRLVVSLAVQIRPLVGKPPEVLRDLLACGQRVLILPLNPLLLLIFPLAIHDADFEMITPVRLQDVLLAVRTLLVVGPVLLLFLRSAHVVLPHYHVRVKGLVDLGCLLLGLLRRLVVQDRLVLHNLPLETLLLSPQALLVFVHELLLRQDFLIVIELDLLHDNEVVPVDVVLCHLLIALVLSPLGLRDSLLLVQPQLSLLSRVYDLFGVGGEGLVALKVLALWH